MYYNCGLTVHFKSVCTNAVNPERVKKASAAHSKGKEDNKDGEQNILLIAFYDV